MCAVAARLGPRAGRLGSLGHIGFRRGGNRQSGNSDGGSCQGGNPHRGGSRSGREPGVHPSFSRGSPTGSSARHVTGTAPSVSVPAGITGIQVAGRQGVPSVADRQPRVACDRKNISAHFVAAALVARQRHPRQRRDRGSRSKLPDSWPGVSEVVFTSMTMSDNSASIVARAHEWTKSVLRQQGATIGSTRLPQESRSTTPS